MEGNVPRLRREAHDASALTRSPLADHKDGGGGGGGVGGVDCGEEQRSESTADDSAEERESPEESERSLRTDEEEEEETEEEDGEAAAKRAPDPAKTGEGTASPPPPLAALVVQCKCCEGDVRASIDTGCQHNHISSFCCRRLGLVPEQGSAGPTVRGLRLQLGTQRVHCSAYVKDDEVSELCLGLQTLLELKCCVDLSGRVLRLQGSGEELPFQVPVAISQCRHDTNKNL
ncbi:nuclear receptor-interacting protein 2 [Gadus macrocephalus]|uniref:nuclear receptor-interacting protein 2 n=1 Tax=Gadus macrocephalus TaxID=80720 RepID=UPI0028CB7CEC|nr:nuclear receptor-interacting protein 2 [Gadus macrocephalus]